MATTVMVTVEAVNGHNSNGDSRGSNSNDDSRGSEWTQQ